MARNWYSEAIDIIQGDHDWKKIVIEIAKKHPKLIVVTKTMVAGSSWQDECRNLRDSQGLVHAVKHCRNVTGMGLKEAKEACEAL